MTRSRSTARIAPVLVAFASSLAWSVTAATPAQETPPAPPAAAESGTKPGPAPAPLPPEMIEREYRAAQDLENAGRAEPARAAYRKVLDAAPTGPYAAECLLAIARIAWPVSSPDQLGRKAADPKVVADAREALDRVLKEFPSAEGPASEAAWRLALQQLEPTATTWNADAALTRLTTLPTLYPASPRVPEALGLAARLELEAGRPARARTFAFRLLDRFPDRNLPDAWIALAEADVAEKRPHEALAELGEARRSPEAAYETGQHAALALSTLLDRILFSSGRGARPFEMESGPGVAMPGKVRDMAVDANGTLAAIVPGEKSIVRVPAGRPVETRPAPGAEVLAFDRWGRLWTAGESTVTPPAEAGIIPALPDRTDIVALAIAGPRSCWVADGKNRRVVRVDGGAGIVATAKLPERTNPVALAADGKGGVWVLDAKAGALTNFAADGTRGQSIPLATVAKDPLDVDIDALGDLYVLDASAPGILVFDPAGQLVVRQPLIQEGEQGIGKPTAIAVDPYGSIAVFDGKKRRVVWLR
jgi:tetratricopeptide (TPR) repeat protein